MLRKVLPLTAAWSAIRNVGVWGLGVWGLGLGGLGFRDLRSTNEIETARTPRNPKIKADEEAGGRASRPYLELCANLKSLRHPVKPLNPQPCKTAEEPSENL